MTSAFPWCLSTSTGAWRRVSETVWATWQTGAAKEALIDWGMMSVAMVPPLAAPLVRYVAVRSFAMRRVRAVAEFLVSALCIWLLVGLALIPLLVFVPMSGRAHTFAVAGGFAVAALWQLAPMKRRALLRCHQTIPLSAFGWRADRDCIGYGLRYATDCVRSCWAMMLACALASHSLAAFACVQAIAVHERGARAPRLLNYALALAGCAAVTLASLTI